MLVARVYEIVINMCIIIIIISCMIIKLAQWMDSRCMGTQRGNTLSVSVDELGNLFGVTYHPLRFFSSVFTILTV